MLDEKAVKTNSMNVPQIPEKMRRLDRLKNPNEHENYALPSKEVAGIQAQYNDREPDQERDNKSHQVLSRLAKILSHYFKRRH